MGESYRQCSECGKRALSIATRCPGCGRDLPAPALPEEGGIRELRRFLTPGGMATLVAVVAVVGSAGLGRTAEVESSMATMVPSYTAEIEPPPAESAGELLVARDWTHVRQSRSVRAPLDAMLMPGDTVLADSLVLGWYRVALAGEVLGYVHRSTLAGAVAGP